MPRITGPHQYYEDESGWHYNLYRYYDPAVGRYASPDPLGLGPDPPAGLITWDTMHTSPFNVPTYYPPSDDPYEPKVLPPGTRFNMVVSADHPDKVGGFGTFDNVPDRNYLHNQLSVLPDWQPYPQVQVFEVPNDGKPFRIQTSKVRPLIDPHTGKMLAPGGGTQIQFLSNSGRLIPVGDPVDLPC